MVITNAVRGMKLGLALAVFCTAVLGQSLDPKFYLQCNSSEVSRIQTGAVVTPSVGPKGVLTVRGTGSLTQLGGYSFKQSGSQNTNTAFLNFTGIQIGQIFNSASQVSFNLTSTRSYSERAAVPNQSMRGVFEVFDSSPRPFYNFVSYISKTGQLQFGFGALGWSSVYTVPAGQEDVVFGKGVTAKIRITWTVGAVRSMSLYVNDKLVQTNNVSLLVPKWDAKSFLTVGARNSMNKAGVVPGYYAMDDIVSEFVVR